MLKALVRSSPNLKAKTVSANSRLNGSRYADDKQSLRAPVVTRRLKLREWLSVSFWSELEVVLIEVMQMVFVD